MSGIVIAAYGDVGYRCTQWLLDAGEAVRLVYTHPDDPKETRWFGSVAELAQQRGIPVLLVESLDEPAEAERVRVLSPEFLFSFYFRRMIPATVVSIPTRGALNVHGSLLPAFRGRSPVNWAILKGATETGASLHYMTDKPDAGDLVDQERVPIGPDDDALTVARRVGDAAVTVLSRSWPKLKAGTAPRTPLDLSKGSYFGGRKPEDGAIDWFRPAKEVHDLVRAVAPPWPGAFTDVFGPKVTVLKTRLAGYGGHDTFPGKVEPTEGSVIVYAGDDRPVEILSAQPEGQPPMDAVQFRIWLLRRG
ncbi:formyltransferase [Acidobacteria bacterium ACD]|nr:MAG: formyltransferase [Acidobacteriota bacterium]MCE7959346.1 formyltransferase [Acidobacteria bacterium ACB2]MDL1950245.1 formyltransferase [Acidobacteria bacterium ACD]